jgi:hypothetical protein
MGHTIIYTFIYFYLQLRQLLHFVWEIQVLHLPCVMFCNLWHRPKNDQWNVNSVLFYSRNLFVAKGSAPQMLTVLPACVHAQVKQVCTNFMTRTLTRQEAVSMKIRKSSKNRGHLQIMDIEY